MLRLVFIFNLMILASVQSALLISGFDPFDGASGNNSMAIGKAAVKRLKELRPNIEIKYCQLRTVYDKSAQTLKDCVASMQTPPSLVLSLGETNCGEVKIETRAFNFNRDISQDNDGVHREGSRIEPYGPTSLGMNYPIHKLWCSLSKRDKRYTVVSRNAGSFVCNNLAYHVLHDYPEVPIVFAHVPSDSCQSRPGHHYKRSLDIIIAFASKAIELGPVAFKMPATKNEARDFFDQRHGCEREFFRKLIRAY